MKRTLEDDLMSVLVYRLSPRVSFTLIGIMYYYLYKLNVLECSSNNKQSNGLK